MEAVLDKFGRIVIPKEIRDALGLRPGSTFFIEENNQEILLKPIEETPHLKNVGGWLVFAGEIQGDFSRIVESVREERIRHVAGMKI